MEPLAKMADLHISIPEHVAMKHIVRRGQNFVTLFDKSMGTLATISDELMQGINRGVQQNFPIGKVWDEFHPTGSAAKRERLLKFIAYLSACELVECR